MSSLFPLQQGRTWLPPYCRTCSTSSKYWDATLVEKIQRMGLLGCLEEVGAELPGWVRAG